MNSKFYYLIITIGIILQSCTEDSTKIESYFGFDIQKETIDNHLEKEMERLNIPGMSIAFINDGRIVHHKTFGFSNLQNEITVTDKTIFEGASISKSVFAYFVMKYVEEGLLDLDTPLYTYYHYADIAHDERYKKITARMVLSHRSGFPNWRSDLPDNKLNIAFEPGTDFLYSGEGYQYLAKVLKHLENTTWEGLEESFQSKVAIPLGMKHTVFIQDTYSKSNKAEPYDENGKWISPEKDIDSLFRYQFRAPASIHSESLDFSKWLIALMNQEGLNEKSYDELFKVHSYVDKYSGIDIDYTLGFYIARLPFTKIYSHGGNNYGFTSWFAVDPDKKWGFVLFTNSEYGEELGGKLSFELLFGPNPTKLYLLIGILVIVILTGLFMGGRILIKRIKKRRHNNGYIV